MKTIFSMILILLYCSPEFTKAEKVKIDNFHELMNALRGGENVRVIIHYAECALIMGEDTVEAPDAVGGMDFSTFEYFAAGSIRNEKAYVTTSENVLISHSYYGYVYNYAKIRIYEDSSVEIVVRYLDPKTFEEKMDEKFVSEIKSSVNNGGVYLFY